MEKGSRKREKMAENGEKMGKKWGHLLYFYFLMLENLFPFIYVNTVFAAFRK